MKSKKKRKWPTKAPLVMKMLDLMDPKLREELYDRLDEIGFPYPTRLSKDHQIQMSLFLGGMLTLNVFDLGDRVRVAFHLNNDHWSTK